MVMPPESVPALPKTLLLETCMLWFQPCKKTPPPPWELLVKVRPSMRDGLQRKLLGKAAQSALLFVSTREPVGKLPSAPTLLPSMLRFSPFARTVMAAPSYAPMSEGSCRSSARLPLTVVSQPTIPSSGSGSTLPRITNGSLAAPAGQRDEYVPVGS